MKKLITICVLFITGIGFLRGQSSIPVSIAGNVRNDGQMRSVGPVHLLANSQEETAKVGNYGTFNMDSSVIFYSKITADGFDGLLMNKNGAPSSVQPLQVEVRMTFATAALYQVSFPFDVDMSNGILDPVTRLPLTHGDENHDGDYYVQEYSGALRAEHGQPSEDNWVTIPYNTSKTLSKGVAYRIGADDEKSFPYVMTFVAKTTSTNISDLFALKQKGISLAYDQCTMFYTPENSSGWNALGGLNSTDYEITSSTIGYGGAVYYWDDGAADYSQIYPKDKEEKGTLRPYAVIFVQTTPTTNLTYSTGSTDGGFTYYGDGSGLVLDRNASYPVFRSSSNVDNDLIKVALAQNGNSLTSKVYFEFNNSYNPSFIPEQGDCVVWQTSSSAAPVVWSLVNNEENQQINTFVDCVPYNNNEIPLGVSFPANGSYTFSLKSVNSTTFDKFDNIDLWDAAKGVTCDLLTKDYSFDASSGSATDRFVLFINKSMTNIDQVVAGDIYAYAENNLLTVKNLKTGDKVQVMDVSGRTIASGIAASDTYSTPVNQKGVYLVYVEGKTLKVLNK